MGRIRSNRRGQQSPKVESSGSYTVNSEVYHQQWGLSFGYLFGTDKVAYLSYIDHRLSTRTTVTNTFGSFGPYLDTGDHHLWSIGIGNHGTKGFSYTIDGTRLIHNWVGADVGHFDSLGFQFGYNW